MNRNVYLGLGVLLGAIWSGCSAQNGGPDSETGGSVGTGGGQNPTTGGISNGGVASPTGGSSPKGGASSSGGSTTNTGGSTTTTGGSTTNTGGTTNAGGSNTGGVVGQGGSSGNGGKSSAGGSSTGGSAGSGGKGNTGGSGGKSSTGGQGNGGGGRGGSSTGGNSTGGNSTGGNSTGGNSTGGNSTGGATSTSCALSGSPNPGSASFTYYYFMQGTYKDPSSGKYQTACGYLGTGSGSGADSVENIANPAYFVAIPGQNSSTFANSKYCGGCVQLTNGGNSVIATVIDECPQDSNPKCVNAHLDVSKTAFDKLGYTVGDPTGTTWKFVPCPVTGNVKVRVKNGNPNEIYIENLIVPLQSVTMNGAQANRQSYGAWHFSANISAGATLTLTDVAGRSITVTVSSTNQGQNQDTGKQFPTCQ